MEKNTFEKFMEGVEIFIKGIADRGEKVYMAPVLKNNGVSYHGLVIQNSISNVAPTIYLESYYDKYLSGVPLLDVYYEVWECYKKHQPEESFEVSQFLDFEQLKKKVVMRLVNTKWNEGLLQDVPHVSFLDLSVLFYCAVDNFDEYATILIQNRHMSLWGITENELYEMALENTPEILPYQIFDMKVYMEKKLELSFDSMEEGEMLLLTNRIKIHGATSILYPDVLESKKVKLVSLKENMDTSTPTGKLLRNLLGVINEFERENMLERQREGIAIAKREGKYKGRKPKELVQFDEVYGMWKNGEITAVNAAKLLGISRGTFYKKVKELEKS